MIQNSDAKWTYQRVAVAVAYIQHRSGEDFTGPTWARAGLQGLVCPCCGV
jgi:hypothetical protein